MENPTPAAVNPPANHADEIAQLKAQLDTEKKARITREVNSHVESLRIPAAQAEKWITRAMKDETVLSDLAALPVNRPGGEPVGHVIEGRSVPLEDIRKEPVAAKRFVTMRDDWNALLSDALKRDSYAGRSLPVNANSYQSALVTQFLLDGAVTQLQNRWALLKAYTKDYSTDAYKPLATAQLKYVTAGSSTLTNATNFEQGNSTVGNVSVTVSQYSQPFQVSNNDLNSGLRMENLVAINTAAFANKVTEVATAPITIANYETSGGQQHLVSAPTSFGFSDMATLWGQLKKSDIKNLILDGEYMARIINNPTLFQATGANAGSGWKAFGWDGVYLNTDWTGADANVRGFACNPQAIAAVSGLPLTPPNIPGATLQQSVSTVPDVNVSFAAYSWFSLASRTMWMSYDIMFGASAADKSAGVLVTSA